MGGELFKKLRANVEQVCQKLPDTRRQKLNLRYPVADFMNCAFAVFFFHHQPLLDFQRQMKERLGRNNRETVVEVRELPTDTQIQTVLGQTQLEHLSPLVNVALQTAWEAGVLEGYRVLDGGVLIALDGVWYHSSETIHCDRWLHVTKEEVITYYPAIQSIKKNSQVSTGFHRLAGHNLQNQREFV